MSKPLFPHFLVSKHFAIPEPSHNVTSSPRPQGHTEMCSLLLEHGADVNQQAKNGLAAMHLAAQEDRVPVALLLNKNGAEVRTQQAKKGLAAQEDHGSGTAAVEQWS